MSQPNERDKWINLSALHEKEIYDLQGKVADLVRLQLETLEERNKAEAENERLRKAGDAMYRYVGKEAEHSIQIDKHNKSKSDWLAAKEGKPLTKHEDDIRRGLRTK